MPERQVMSLNGMWQIAFDPDNVGKAEGWQGEFPTVVEEIRVPSVWNEMRPGYVGVAWYRTKFDADESWADRVVRVKLGAASYYAEVWLNGEPIGSHEGGYTPFALDAGKALRPGDTNTLVVRVLLPPLTKVANFLEPWEPTANDGIDGFRLEEVANSKQFYYGNFGGLWQDVELIVTGRVWIADVFIKPNVHDGSIAADITVRNDTGEAIEGALQLKVEEFIDEETAEAEEAHPEDLAPPAVLAEEEHALELAPGESVHTFTVTLEDFLFWSPEAPFIYTLSVSFEDGDGVKEIFGLREFTVEDNRFHLNGEPITLKAALFQPSYPVTLAYPFDREFAEREVRLAKEAGFNCLRMHIKTPPPVTLEFCDKLGMLVQEEPPIGWMKNSPHMTERCLREVREMVLRDRNHPCVVVWSMLNETGNFFETKDGAQTIKAELCLEARRHDPTRVVTDDSGGVEWSKDTAKYLAPCPAGQACPPGQAGSAEFVPYYDYHPYKPGPVDDEIFEYLRTTGIEGQLNYLSEFGFGGLGDLSTVLDEYAKYGDTEYQDKVEMAARFKKLDAGLERFGLYEIFPSFTAFAEAAQQVQALAAQRQIEAMRANPKIGGYCFTQFQDAGFEFGAGMVDAFRRPKAVAGALAVANSPLVFVAWCPRRNVTAGERVRVALWVVNEIGYEGEVTMEWALLDEDNDPVHKERFGAQLGPGITTLEPVEVALDVAPGHYVFEAHLIYMGNVVRVARAAFTVFEPVSLEGGRAMQVVAPSDELAKALDALGALWSPWSPDAVAELVLVPPFEKLDAAARPTLEAVMGQVKAGAEAIVFELPKLGGDEPSLALGEHEVRVEWSYGLFLGGFHWTRQEALFDGLPCGGLMNDFYRSLYPRNSIMGLEVRPVAGTVMTFGSKFGTDLVRLPHGAGTVTLCQLRILGNLAQDAAAAVFLRNICR